MAIGAPYKDAYKKYEMTPEGISKRAKVTIDFWKGMPDFRSVELMVCQMSNLFDRL